jgi:hypothetical protein
MMSAMKSTVISARPAPSGIADSRYATARRKLSAYAGAVAAKLRAIAPYAAIELLLPGGSVMALLLWLYRRQRRVSAFATREILSLL